MPAPCADLATWPQAQLLEQLLMVRGEFDDLPASAAVVTAGVGALVLFGQPAAAQAGPVGVGLAALQAVAGAAGQVAPWMATDEEGGTVARLAGVAGSLPSARTMAATWSALQIGAALADHGRAMRSIGVTMDLAPVLDVAPANDTVADEADRSFSDDPSTVAVDGAAFAGGLRRSGVVPVAKHFPGLGRASADTDLGPSVDPPLASLEASDLLPFRHAVDAGVTVVMVGHPVVPGLSGGLPASLSSATYRLLRNGLGFTGVAITDSLAAGAVASTGLTEAAAAVDAVEAGADMAMIEASVWPATMGALAAAAASAQLTRPELEAHVARILTAKGIEVCRH